MRCWCNKLEQTICYCKKQMMPVFCTYVLLMTTNFIITFVKVVCRSTRLLPCYSDNVIMKFMITDRCRKNWHHVVKWIGLLISWRRAPSHMINQSQYFSHIPGKFMWKHRLTPSPWYYLSCTLLQFIGI